MLEDFTAEQTKVYLKYTKDRKVKEVEKREKEKNR